MKTILITGASSGIGARTAALLAQQGHQVLGAARRTQPISQLAGVIPIALDLSDPQSVTEVARTLPKIDILINCAGYGEFGSIEDTTPNNARHQMEVNVLGPIALTRAVLPMMRQAGQGRIVNVSSLAGEFAAPLGGWYHASKFALEALSDSLRGEVKHHGIEVVVVQPGYVHTAWHDEAMQRLEATSSGGAYTNMAAAMKRYFQSSVVRRQMASVDQVARTIVKAATSLQPKTRYRVGPGANLAVALHTLLPDRTFDALIRKQFGYPT